MNILVVGSGGREHALVWKLSRSPRVSRLFAAPGSDAIGTLAQCVNVTDVEAIADFAERERIDLTVVGPEAPLVAGLVDTMRARGLAVFGPTAAAARLEGSKVFAKAFMQRHGIPTAAHAAFERYEDAAAHVAAGRAPFVIKADGLAAGKGVVIAPDREAAEAALHEAMVARGFGEAGSRVVIEEHLTGEEASYFVVTDGEAFVAFPSAQDHKPIGNLDRGPNTGGMGAYCPAPVVTPAVEQRIVDEVVRPTLAGMAAEGHPYTGVLYVGLMIGADGTPRVIEYNCRFGDPECQPLMLMLESDLTDLLQAAVSGTLAQARPVWRQGAAACVVMASAGYPGSYAKGEPISGLETPGRDDDGAVVFHAGTRRDGEGRWLTAGGRVLGVTAHGDTLAEALRATYRTVRGIRWRGATYRDDIGLKGMKHQGQERPATNVGIVLGSASDLDVARKATGVLEKLGLGYELAVASAHRTPERVRRYVGACEEAGAEVFIAIAGMAAALPGVVAAETTLPVIGVPVKGSFEGMDALLSIAQMPPGIPVATVAVGGGANAALLAAGILAVKYPDVAAALKEYRLAQAAGVEDAHREAGLSKLI